MDGFRRMGTRTNLANLGYAVPLSADHIPVSALRQPARTKRSTIREDVTTGLPAFRFALRLRSGQAPCGLPFYNPNSKAQKSRMVLTARLFHFKIHSLFQNRHQAFNDLIDDVRRGAFDEAGFTDGPVQGFDLMGVDAAVDFQARA